MNVLSLFGGIETGLIVLKRRGIKVDKYYSSETDKYARAVSRYLHPGIIQLGDIKDYKNWDLPKIDLILAGPPCQGFSVAGTGLNWADPRSKLFYTAVGILWMIQKRNPKVKFLFENVASMRKNIAHEISKLMAVDHININSNLVSAQNRNRNYWTNLPGPILPIKDQNIYLKDILEPEVDEKYYLNNSIQGKRALKNLVESLRYDWEKSKALTSSGRGFSNAGSTVIIVQVPRGNNKGGIRALDGKTPSLTSSSWEYNNFIFQMIKKNASDETFLKVSKKLRLKDFQNKSSCLTGGGKAAGDHSHTDWLIFEDLRFRRFTPIETERLQTLSDNTTEFGINKVGALVKISNTQRYKMTGNGWTAEVIDLFLRYYQ